VRDMFARSAAFRAWVQAEDEAAAKDLIALCVSDEALSDREGSVFLMLDYGQGARFKAQQFGTGSSYGVAVDVFVYCEMWFEEEVSDREAVIQFGNTWDATLAEVLAQSGGDLSADILMGEVTSGPTVSYGARRGVEGQRVEITMVLTCGTGA